MRSLPPLLALSLLALAGSSRADKAWGQWYWSTFDPEAGAGECWRNGGQRGACLGSAAATGCPRCRQAAHCPQPLV